MNAVTRLLAKVMGERVWSVVSGQLVRRDIQRAREVQHHELVANMTVLGVLVAVSLPPDSLSWAAQARREQSSWAYAAQARREASEWRGPEWEE